ncbi:MAG: TIM barrel protein [Sedimentisphaerales bacterium]|nr:TIM barrel protein [Sedimentisphaerales bacterium]
MKIRSNITRRNFIASAAATAATISAVSAAKAQESNDNEPMPLGKLSVAVEPPEKFKLKYAPSFGMFREHAGNDPIDQLKFMADQGFSAMFDNGLMGKPVDLQEKIAKETQRLNMTIGPFVLYADFGVKSFVTRDKEIRKILINKMKDGVECAKRLGAKWALVVPGHFDEGLEWDYQTANVIDNLKYCVEVCEPSGLILVLEPLNAWTDHPGLFLTKIPQAYQICRAVNSPSCKIVDDIYHQQITEGNLIPNIDMAWSEIAAFHLGDNPGRREPTTGEINYKNIFRHIKKKGYEGVLCMEHGRSKRGKEGEKAVIEAYRACDDF